MLPPKADMARIERLDSATSCIRERETAASSRPKVEAASAVATVMIRNPPQWPRISRPKTIEPQTNMTSSCVAASQAR